MSGIFPEIGVFAQNTSGAQVGDLTVAECAALFYRDTCAVDIDPIALNAVMSEILNVATMSGAKYDCSRLDNMARAIRALAELCSLPTAGAINLANDSLAGCFGGSNGRISLAALRNVLGICGFPVATAVSGSDYFGMCVNGNLAKVSVDDIKAALVPPAKTPTMSSYYPGAQLRNNMGLGGSSGNFDAEGYDAFCLIGVGFGATPHQSLSVNGIGLGKDSGWALFVRIGPAQFAYVDNGLWRPMGNGNINGGNSISWDGTNDGSDATGSWTMYAGVPISTFVTQ